MQLPKWIVTDLDETLLHNDRTVSDRSLRVIDQLRCKGVSLAIATTRSEGYAHQFIELLAPDARVLSGGALGYMGSALLYQKPLDPEFVADLFSTFKSGFPVEGLSVDTPAGRFGRDSILPSPFLLDVYSMFIWTHAGQDIANLGIFGDKAAVIPLWEPRMYRISHRKATKHDALGHLLAGCSPDEVLCFGDDLMDVGMLRQFTGIAVANAKAEAKEAAVAITRSNEEDGVAHYLERYL